jgi:hypothetical protein
MKRLNDIATAALKKHNGNAERAAPEFASAVKAAKLIDELAREFLRLFATRESGQSSFETHPSRAGLTPSSSPMVGSIKVREHDVRQHRRRTQAEKDAAERAMLDSAEAVFEIQIEGRAIGGIAIGELPRLKHDLIDDASHKLILGAEQVRNAVLTELIEQHCTVQDQLTRVRDAVSASTLKQLIAQAEQEAPRRISEAMRRAAEAIEHREIAV